MFKLLNQEFTFDVDVSQLPCGVNGALYFVEMDQVRAPANRRCRASRPPGVPLPVCRSHP